MPIHYTIEQAEYDAQAEAYQQELEQRRQDSEAQARACVRDLAETAIRAGHEEWADLSDGQQLDLAAALIRAEGRPVYRFEYVSETRLAETLPLRIAQAMANRDDRERFYRLGRDLVIAALGYAAYAGQEALDQARERLAAHQVGLTEEEWQERRERSREMAKALRWPTCEG